LHSRNIHRTIQDKKEKRSTRVSIAAKRKSTRPENITIQENGKLTTPCSKEPIRGIMKYTHQQLLQIIEKHNDPRKWETHHLLKRTHPGKV